jgi:hypothetical protein
MLRTMHSSIWSTRLICIPLDFSINSLKNNVQRECGIFEIELHVTFYVQTIKIHILNFLKNLKKNLEVANDVCYNGAKSQCKLICILGNTKLTKSDNFIVLKYALFTLKFARNCHLFCRLEYDIVCIKILHHCSIHYWLSQNFVSNSLKLQNMNSDGSQINGYM